MATIYAVRVGNAPGIYYDIGEYEAQLNGFPEPKEENSKP